MPQRKKDPSARARANKASTAATLEPVEIPDFSDWTLAELKLEIGRLNADRSLDMQLPLTGGKAKLVEALTSASSPVPELPEHPDGWWHKLAADFWHEAWTSPMRSQWHVGTDFFNVLICTYLTHDWLTASSASGRVKAMNELRQQRMTLGLSPYDRRRLEWTTETADEAKARGAQRRGEGRPPAPPKQGDVDPRAALHSVS